ncbi:MAG: septum formation protein Maf [Spirochaetaceae bacterium]|nr:septum formation protein Maf [Spirochaetaceae bacterium]
MRKKLNSYFDTIILASASQARKDILIKEGLEVIVRPTDTNEILENVSLNNIENKLISLAEEKLNQYLDQFGFQNIPILTCDTVIYFNNKIIGKSKDKDDAFNTLISFSGKMQQVYSGMCLKLPNKRLIKCCDVANVYFKNNSTEDINKYINTEEWLGAAGSYRIQSKGYNLIDKYLGDFNTIVGLPLLSISGLLNATLS